MARHYLDHASTTPLRPEAKAAMDAWSDLGITADPGRVHTEGRMVRATLEDARDQIAGLFGVRPRQVVLTSGATEAVNAAVWGVLADDRGAPVALAAVEHSAVRDGSARFGTVVDVGVDGLGRITAAAAAEALERCLRDHGRLPALLHCQAANHEVGTLAGRRRRGGARAGAGRDRCTSTRPRRPATCRSTSTGSGPIWCRCRPTSWAGRSGWAR